MRTTTTLVVWDLPVRITHWLFVATIAVSWWTAEQHMMDWHQYSGLTLLGLLVFRIYWGFAGTSTARFSDFVRGPRALWKQLRGEPSLPRTAGHSISGGWSVMALLTLMLAQVGVGLFVTDVDGLESGPLSHWVSFDTGRALADLHELIFNILLGFIALHIAAILFYLLVRRENLIVAMLNGRRRNPPVGVTVEHVPAWRLLPGIALAALIVWLVAR